MVWLECKETRHQWSGPKAKAETKLRDQCLDGWNGHLHHREALCIVALTEASGEVKWGRVERRKTGGKERACGKKELARSKL